MSRKVKFWLVGFALLLLLLGVIGGVYFGNGSGGDSHPQTLNTQTGP